MDYSKTLLDVYVRDGFAIGTGIDLGRLSFEFRYYSSRNILGEYEMWTTNYLRIGFIFGFKILKVYSHKKYYWNPSITNNNYLNN